MKRAMFICLALLLLLLPGCGAIGGNDTTQPTVNPVEPDAPPTIIVQEAPAISQIVGSWHAVIPMDLGAGLLNYEVVLTYSLDGTGRETLSYTPWDWSLAMDFTWTAENGNLTVTSTEGALSITATSTYSVLGDILTAYSDGVARSFNRLR